MVIICSDTDCHITFWVWILSGSSFGLDVIVQIWTMHWDNQWFGFAQGSYFFFDPLRALTSNEEIKTVLWIPANLCFSITSLLSLF